MRKLGTVCAEVDATKIIEDSDEYLVVPAIIAREGVYPYPEGKAFKPADELKQASFTAEGAWVVAEKHPDTLIVTQRKDIKGRVENVAWGEDISGIRANIRLYKKMNDLQFIEAVKSGQRKDVSIGFFYDFDPTAGEWKGQQYDFVQRNLLVDHVAAGVPVGRCRSPYCGIAVDSLIRKVSVDPEETADFIHIPIRDAGDFVDGSFRTIELSADQGIEAVIGKLKTAPEGSTHIQKFIFAKAKGWTMDKAQSWANDHKQSADAEWDTAYVNNLPDSAFAYIEPGGEKDEEGKTKPRSLRHLEYKNAQGEIDHDHLVAALAALGGAHTGHPPPYAGEAKGKLCAAVASWNKSHPDSKIESKVCGEGDCLLLAGEEIRRAKGLLGS